MSREMKAGDRGRIRTWTGMPDYFFGDKGTVLRCRVRRFLLPRVRVFGRLISLRRKRTIIY